MKVVNDNVIKKESLTYGDCVGKILLNAGDYHFPIKMFNDRIRLICLRNDKYYSGTHAPEDAIPISTKVYKATIHLGDEV